MADISHFSITNSFWIQFKDYCINFGFKGLPEKVHYTIAFNDDSKDVNFHITKQISEDDNPQIRILEADKAMLNQGLSEICEVLLNYMLVPLDLKMVELEVDDNISFHSFHNFENTDLHSVIEQKFIEMFKNRQKFKITKRRFKIKDEIDDELFEYSNSQEVTEAFKNFRLDIKPESSKPIDGGIIITNEDSIPVLRCQNQWYKLNTNRNPSDFLKLFMDSASEEKLINYLKISLENIKQVTTQAEARKFSHPLRYIFKKNTVYVDTPYKILQ